MRSKSANVRTFLSFLIHSQLVIFSLPSFFCCSAARVSDGLRRRTEQKIGGYRQTLRHTVQPVTGTGSHPFGQFARRRSRNRGLLPVEKSRISTVAQNDKIKEFF